MARFERFSLVTFLVIVSLLGPSFAQPGFDCVPNCWEMCLTIPLGGLGRFNEVFDQIHEIANDIIALKNIYKITDIAWLIDSALSDRHIEDYDYFAQQDDLKSYLKIYQIQLDLLLILNIMIGNVDHTLVPYNENYAWSCEEMSCNNGCAAQYYIDDEGFLLGESLISDTSFCPGNVESACKLGHSLISDCNSENNPMLVAITNGDLFVNGKDRMSLSESSSDSSSSDSSVSCPAYTWDREFFSKSVEDDYFSPCKTYFDTRYVIGMHSGRKDNNEKLASMHAKFSYFHDSEYTFHALKSILECFSMSCCMGETFSDLDTCYKTDGPFGDIINPYQ